VLHIDRTVCAAVTAPPARCLEVLADIEGYTRWSRLIADTERMDDGRIRLRASVLGLTVEMQCALEVGRNRAVLTRIPNDRGDDERYEATWSVRPGEVALHVVADIDAPGPAGLLRGRVARHLTDDLLADFVRAL
jgi:Polyketide cyclase / dehydrase and lipid transport